MDFLDRMLDHEEWAMAKLFDASAGLSDEQLDQPFDLGHGTVRATFEHIVNETTGFADAVERSGRTVDCERGHGGSAAPIG